MPRSESYNTKQKELIFDAIRKHQNEFTIKDIYKSIQKKAGLTTIYRLIDKLVASGIINKYIGENNITYYQYLKQCNEDNHFYLKCNNCKDMIHVDCDCIKELSTHLMKKHNFSPSKGHIIINGICEKCICKANNIKKEELK